VKLWKISISIQLILLQRLSHFQQQ